MMEVQKFLKEHGIEELKKQFAIVVTDYPDRVVLNYNQIESPRFITLVDECRGLILKKDTWEVMAMSFQRFYNLGESVESKNSIDIQRVANSNPENITTQAFDINKAKILDKLDGSLMSLYWDGDKWCVSTRKLAFAEGGTNLGRTFAEVFWDAAKKTKLNDFLKENENGFTLVKDYTFVFELTSPENRVVTPYAEARITLLSVRNNKEDQDYHELSFARVDAIANAMSCDRPKYYSVSTFEELVELVKKFPAMEEGVVLAIENSNGTHWRVKCKNPSYLLIAHMRNNGAISPRRILGLIMTGEHLEYLTYFECDKKYFDFVVEEYAKASDRIFAVFDEAKDIKDQKEFALTIMPKVIYPFESGVIFQMRKTGCSIDSALTKLGADKIAKGMNLKKLFIDKFHIVIEEEEGG